MLCILCGELLEEDTVVVRKGLKTVIEASVKRDDCVHERLEGKTSVRVHKVCRQNYTRPSSIKSAIASSQSPEASLPSLRSLGENFDYKTNCFICGNTAVIDSKTELHRRKEIRMVATLEIKDNLLQIRERNDEWGEKVKARLLSVSDLVAPEAR